MDVQMKTVTLNPSDLISVLSFLENFKTACDYNSIHELAAMCLFSHFICQPATSVLSHQVTAHNKKNHQHEVSLQSIAKWLATCWIRMPSTTSAPKPKVSPWISSYPPGWLLYVIQVFSWKGNLMWHCARQVKVKNNLYRRPAFAYFLLLVYLPSSAKESYITQINASRDIPS